MKIAGLLFVVVVLSGCAQDMQTVAPIAESAAFTVLASEVQSQVDAFPAGPGRDSYQQWLSSQLQTARLEIDLRNRWLTQYRGSLGRRLDGDDLPDAHLKVLPI